MVLGRHGYETAVKGKNGFVCVVQRSWTAGIDDPDFWNPKLRAPICFNPPAARSHLPLTIKKTELVLAARSKAQIFEDLKAAFDEKELSTVESSAMCYMMAKQGAFPSTDLAKPPTIRPLARKTVSIYPSTSQDLREDRPLGLTIVFLAIYSLNRDFSCRGSFA